MQLGAGWEAAVACLKSTLESASESMTSAESLLAVKDLVLLVCTALGMRWCLSNRGRHALLAPATP